MATFTNDWNAAFNAAPVKTDNAANAATDINVTRTAIREVVVQEHNFSLTAVSTQGQHKKGSARVFYQADAPTTSPGGDALASGDQGRLWLDSDDNTLSVWNGTAFDSVSVSSSGASDGVVETGSSATIKMKVIEIGDWNMDSTNTVSVAHGLTYANIRDFSVKIRNDAANATYPLDMARDFTFTGSNPADGFYYVGSTTVEMARTIGGFFDSVAYDSTSFNRGWITIWYEA